MHVLKTKFVNFVIKFLKLYIYSIKEVPIRIHPAQKAGPDRIRIHNNVYKLFFLILHLTKTTGGRDVP